MTKVHLDYETFSEVNLKETGLSVYSKHDSTEVLMCAYAFDDGPVKQWIPAEGEDMPEDLLEALTDPRIEKWAWNAPFEMAITAFVLGIDVDVTQWRCAMVLAMHQSLPGKLEKAAVVVGLPEDKQKDRKGAALMRKFSFPRKPTKRDARTRNLWHSDFESWNGYLAYNVQDVVTERAVCKRLYPMPWSEWELWFMDQAINAAGLPVNRRMINNAIKIYEEALGSVESGTGAFGEMAEITGLANPNSNTQLLPWLQEHGYPFDDMVAAHIKVALEYFERRPDHWADEDWQRYRSSNSLHRILELRQQVSLTSIKKYYALQKATDEDDCVRHVLQMNGASRTGRYAGRIYQPQNLKRPLPRFEDYQETLAKHVEECTLEELKLVHGNVFDVLASSLRPVAQAPEGMVFVDADLNAIENRVLGWLSGCTKILDVFHQNQDPYIAFASYLYETPYDLLWHEYKVLKDKSKRTIAKPGTLGAGYGMGAGQQKVNNKTGEIEATGLLGYAWGMGVKQFTEEDAKHSIDTFRREFSEVKDLWYAMERAAKKCVRTGRPTRCGFVRFIRKGPYLCMILPSGRPLYYLKPRLEMRKTPWGEVKETLTYEGMNDKRQWVRIHTTPGKIVENADQAISRDLLVHGMKLAVARGLDIRLHVHDQIISLEDERGAEKKLETLIDCMGDVPDWAPGLPLGSEGHFTKFMVKD
jgi:DNA polymerase